MAGARVARVPRQQGVQGGRSRRQAHVSTATGDQGGHGATAARSPSPVDRSHVRQARRLPRNDTQDARVAQSRRTAESR
jgi:hypothetical protein